MRGTNLMLGMAIGATAAFVADPLNGRRRRALARDTFVRARRKTRDALDTTMRHVSKRVRGVTEVAGELDAYESPEAGPALHRDIRAADGSVDLHQPAWAPQKRALMTAAGLAATGLLVASYARR
jgi:hypothetical protein